MRLSDIQPQYFPRLHYVARMLAADVFVFRDEVQFVRRHRYPDGSQDASYQAHTPIKGPAGRHLLGVPVRNHGKRPIWETRVVHDEPWVRKHVSTIKSYYKSAPRLRALAPELEQLLGCRFSTIADLDIATTCWALGHLLGEALRIPDELSIARVNELLAAQRTVRLRRIVLGSEHASAGEVATASERIAWLCRRFDADEYVGGGTAVRAYLDRAPFEQSGITLAIQDWTCREYPQQHVAGAGFLRDLSILDLLMNAPADEALSLLCEA